MTTTNFIDGLTNVPDSVGLGSYVAPSPARVHQFFDDFDSFSTNVATTPAVPGDWLLTAVGSSTAAVVDADGGVVAAVTGATTNNAAYLQWQGRSGTVAETFLWSASKAMWFETRFKVSDATDSALAIGLQITDTTPLDVTDGLFFSKADESTSLVFNAEKDNAASTVTAGDLVDDTWVVASFAYLPTGGYGGAPILNVFLDGNRVGSLTSFANFPDDEEIAVSFGILTGADAAKTLSIDYILAAKER